MNDAEPTDALVLGAGAAGLSTALWLARLGLSFRLVDRRQRLGGQLLRVQLPIRDYLGCEAPNGRALAERFGRQLSELQESLLFGVGATGVLPDRVGLRLADGRILRAKALVLAPGLRRRRLDLPDEQTLVGRGVSYSATADMPSLRGRPVAVVGGGDGALENAALLAAVCPRVWLVHRGTRLRARPDLVQRAIAYDNLHVVGESSPVALNAAPSGQLESLDLRGPAGVQRIPVAWLVVKIGFTPNTELLSDAGVSLDPDGYIDVDRYQRTSRRAVLAAGDASNPRSPSLAASVGDGARAAREVLELLREGS